MSQLQDVPITARVLIRNLESDLTQLEFDEFSITSLANNRRWDAALEYFPEAMRDEWLLEPGNCPATGATLAEMVGVLGALV